MIRQAIEIAAGSWLLAAVVYRALAFGALRRGLAAPSRPTARDLPAAAVLVRPLNGDAPYVEPCLDSLLHAAHVSGAPVRIGIQDGRDPARVVAARALERWPGVRAALCIGGGPGGANRKVANLIQTTTDAQAAIAVLSDADVAVPPDYVARVTAPFAEAAVGLVTCPYRCVPAAPWLSRIDALMTNANFLPNTFLAVATEGLHFGLGATIAVRREALAAAGGFEAILDRGADDYWLARNVEAAGYRLAWVPILLEHFLADGGLRAMLHRQLRWARATREPRLLGYLGMGLSHGILPALALAAAAIASVPWAGLLPVAWWAVEGALLWRCRAWLDLAFRDLVWLPCADLLAAATYCAGFAGSPEPPITMGATEPSKASLPLAVGRSLDSAESSG